MYSLLFHWHMESPLQAWGQIQSSTHCFYLPRTMSGKRSSRGNACNEDVDGRSVRYKITCTHFPLKKAWLMQSPMTPEAFLRCILLTIALYLSPDEHGKQIYTTIFAYHVKTSIPQCNEDAIQIGRVKWPGRPVAVWTWLSQRRAPGFSRLHTLEIQFA